MLTGSISALSALKTYFFVNLGAKCAFAGILAGSGGALVASAPNDTPSTIPFLGPVPRVLIPELDGLDVGPKHPRISIKPLVKTPGRIATARTKASPVLYLLKPNFSSLDFGPRSWFAISLVNSTLRPSAKRPSIAAARAIQDQAQATPTPAANPSTQPPAGQAPAQTLPAVKPAVQPQAPLPLTTPGLVTNAFVDTDIKVALSESASQAGVTIIVDDSIKEQNINIEFKATPIREVLDRLALTVGGVWKEKSDGVFLFASGKPESPLFYEFAVTKRYVPENVLVESLAALIPPSLKDYVQSDKTTNTLTITAPEQRMDRIMNSIKAIDSPYRQIVVEALITEVDANTSAQFGFSWSWKNFSQGSDLGLAYTNVSQSDVAQVMALIGSGQISLRANPRVSALEGHEAMISVGQETYFPVITSGNAQFQSAQVQLIRTGVILKFTGFIGDDGLITLILNPEVSDDFETVASAPTTKIRKLSSTVRIKAGQTIAIGGLVQENISDTRSKIPILGDIPWLGLLFRNQTITHRKLETVILVTPYLTEDGAGIKGKDSSRPLLTPPIVTPGVKSGKGQMPILPTSSQ